MLGQVGADGAADFMLAALAGAGVDAAGVRRVAGPTGTAVILLQPCGENSIVIVGGANTAPWDLTDHGLAAVPTAGALLLQREVPEGVSLAAARAAGAAGVPVVLDAGGADGEVGADLLALVSVLSPNETELARMTGEMVGTSMDGRLEGAGGRTVAWGGGGGGGLRATPRAHLCTPSPPSATCHSTLPPTPMLPPGLPSDTEAEVEAAAEALLARGVPAVLVKRGSAGSALFQAGAPPVWSPAAPVASVVDQLAREYTLARERMRALPWTA